jgi:hypothetical protein
MDYSAIIRRYKGAAVDFSALGVGRWYRLRCRADRKSMPERISAHWVELISMDTASPAATGSWNEPVWSRLYQIARPSLRSQYRILRRPRRRLTNKNRWPDVGSWPKALVSRPDSASKPLRRSVGGAWRNIRTV